MENKPVAPAPIQHTCWADMYISKHSWKCVKCGSIYTEPDNRPIPEVLLCDSCNESNRKNSSRQFKSPLPMIYAAMLNGAREMCESHGYALAIHGSMSRDFDVIAIPWREDCSPPSSVIASLTYALHHLIDGKAIGPENKPHGRMAWAIPMGNGAVLDVSIMPPNAQADGPPRQPSKINGTTDMAVPSSPLLDGGRTEGNK